MAKKILVIDTFNFLYRAYYALPKTLRNSSGQPVNAVYGVVSMIVNLFNTLKPNIIYAAVESLTPTYRDIEFESYRANRKPMEDDLKTQIQMLFDFYTAMGIKQLGEDGYEADDIIGCVSKVLGQENQVFIASNDKDFFQLVTDNVIIVSPAQKGAFDFIGQKEIQARLGFGPDFVCDFKALRGDPSDNVPGVPGIGEKTAKELILQFGHLEDIYDNLKKITSPSIKQKLELNKDLAFLSKRIVTINTSCERIDFDVENSTFEGLQKEEFLKKLEEFNFKSLRKKVAPVAATSLEQAALDQSHTQVGLFD